MTSLSSGSRDDPCPILEYARWMNSRRTMEGVRVVLSTLVEEHRQFATELLQDRRTAMFYGKQSYDKESADQTFNLWLTMAAENVAYWWLVCGSGGMKVGVVGVFRLGPPISRKYSVALLIHHAHWDSKIGTEVCDTLLRPVSSLPGRDTLKICMTVHPKNFASRALAILFRGIELPDQEFYNNDETLPRLVYWASVAAALPNVVRSALESLFASVWSDPNRDFPLHKHTGRAMWSVRAKNPGDPLSTTRDYDVTLKLEEYIAKKNSYFVIFAYASKIGQRGGIGSNNGLLLLRGPSSTEPLVNAYVILGQKCISIKSVRTRLASTYWYNEVENQSIVVSRARLYIVLFVDGTPVDNQSFSLSVTNDPSSEFPRSVYATSSSSKHSSTEPKAASSSSSSTPAATPQLSTMAANAKIAELTTNDPSTHILGDYVYRVRGLPPDFDRTKLARLFLPYSPIFLFMAKQQGVTMDFGFVEFANQRDMDAAKALSGHVLRANDGKTSVVRLVPMGGETKKTASTPVDPRRTGAVRPLTGSAEMEIDPPSTNAASARAAFLNSLSSSSGMTGMSPPGTNALSSSSGMTALSSPPLRTSQDTPFTSAVQPAATSSSAPRRTLPQGPPQGSGFEWDFLPWDVVIGKQTAYNPSQDPHRKNWPASLVDSPHYTQIAQIWTNSRAVALQSSIGASAASSSSENKFLFASNDNFLEF